MAKRKAPKPKNYVIKWRSEDIKNLRKAISTFNKNVRKLRKNEVDTDFLPSELDYKGTKELIKNRAEFNRVIKSLSRFSGKEAFKKVTLPSGQQITAWEKREISYQKGVATRRLNKMIKREYRKYYKGGTNRYNELKGTLESIENIFNVNGKKFELARGRIKNYGSQDYEIRIAEIYKSNYLKMLKENFEGIKGYRQLRKKIKEMNAISFYEKLKKMEQGEKVKDIRFMYDTSEYQQMFYLLIDEFEVDINKEDIDWSIIESEEGE